MLRPASPAGPGDRPTAGTQGRARDDRELMRRVAEDDVAAFGAIYDRHARSVYGLAFRLMRERSGAEDVVQETFVALWRSRHSYKPDRGSLGSWLLTITRNRSIDALRRGRGHMYAELDSVWEQEAPERTDDEALRRLEAGTIAVALRTLPEAQRQALELSYFDGLSQTEIAARVGIPLGTVKGRMRLALKKLAAELEARAVLHPAH